MDPRLRSIIPGRTALNSVRLAGLPSGLWSDLQEWLQSSPDTGPDGWLFPSENLKTPAWKDTVWEDHVRPKLKAAGFEWVNFQVLRRNVYFAVPEEQD